MTRRAAVVHAARGIAALARVSMLELLRRGFVPGALLAFAIGVGLHRLPADFELTAARARFLDQGFSAAAAGLVLVVVIFAVQLLSGRESTRSGESASRRLLGATVQYWGRGLGLLAVAVLLGLVCGAVIAVNVELRYGGLFSVEQPLRRAIEAGNFADDQDSIILQPKRSSEPLVFDLRGCRPETPLEMRFHPKLLLVGAEVTPDSRAKVAFVLVEEGGAYRRRRILTIHEGRPLRFALDLPQRRIDRVLITVENASPDWLLKFDRPDVLVLAEARSPAAGILTAGLELGLYAAFFGLLALFLRAFVAAPMAVLLPVALALVAGSLDLLENGLLDRLPEVARDGVMAGLRVVLPDFARHDAAALMVRGIAPSWARLGELAGRIVIGVVLLGLVGRRRGER